MPPWTGASLDLTGTGAGLYPSFSPGKPKYKSKLNDTISTKQT